MGKKADKETFEKKITRLEEISSQLENEDIGLEEAITLYEEGIELSKSCITSLKKAELKITELKKKLDDISAVEEGLFEE